MQLTLDIPHLIPGGPLRTGQFLLVASPLGHMGDYYIANLVAASAAQGLRPRILPIGPLSWADHLEEIFTTMESAVAAQARMLVIDTVFGDDPPPSPHTNKLLRELEKFAAKNDILIVTQARMRKPGVAHPPLGSYDGGSINEANLFGTFALHPHVILTIFSQAEKDGTRYGTDIFTTVTALKHQFMTDPDTPKQSMLKFNRDTCGLESFALPKLNGGSDAPQ